MPKMLSTHVVLAAAAWTMATQGVQAAIFEGFPDAVICEFPEIADRLSGEVIFYVDVRLEDGRVLYKPLGTGPRMEIGKDGVIHTASAGQSCDGQTVQQLRDEGRAIEFGG